MYLAKLIDQAYNNALKLHAYLKITGKDPP